MAAHGVKRLRRELVGKLHHRGKIKGVHLWWLRSYLVRRWPVLRRLRRSVYALIGSKAEGVPEGVVPFVVLASPRTGSNLLLERLTSQWRTVRSDGETFSTPVRGSSTVNGLIRSSYFLDSGHRFVGCKIMASQIDDVDLEVVLKLEGLRVIVLERRNVIRQFVSLKVALADGVFSQPVGTNRSSPSARRVVVEIGELLRYREQWKDWQARFLRATVELPTLHIYYEDLEANVDHEIGRVASFLGLGEPDDPVPPQLRRQNPEPLSELIANFDELRLDLGSRNELELIRDLDA